jgi:hypothetical protein
MVGIAEYDLGQNIFFQFVLMNPFYGSLRADGHENGRLDLPVLCGYYT